MWSYCCLVLWICGVVRGHPRADLEPEFVGVPANVTVTEGSNAVLACVVENLGFYRVAWIRVESQTILSIHSHVITRNYRITLDHKDRQHWNLQIAGVEESDRGQYMCQINTVPMKKRIAFLEVLVPPKFIDRGENAEILAREGTNVTLSCKVRGYPLPTVTWEREDGKKLTATRGHRLLGEDLSIVKVSRLHMGMYLCTATSTFYQAPAYQPVTRGVMLHVLFPPMIWIPHQLAFSATGDTVSLDCYTEAFPMSINYWTKADSCIILPDEKFAVSISDNVYKVSMKLVISGVQRDDFGSYKCIARNSLGSTEGVIRLYESRTLQNKKVMQEENSVENTDTAYRETYQEISIKDASYELMKNANVKENRFPKSALLERQRLSNHITALTSDYSTGTWATRHLGTSALWICLTLTLQLWEQ